MQKCPALSSSKVFKSMQQFSDSSSALRKMYLFTGNQSFSRFSFLGTRGFHGRFRFNFFSLFLKSLPALPSAVRDTTLRKRYSVRDPCRRPDRQVATIPTFHSNGSEKVPSDNEMSRIFQVSQSLPKHMDWHKKDLKCRCFLTFVNS